MKLPELSIERLPFGGSGVGRLEGKVCFVPFSAPGDRLIVRVTKQHRSWLEGELIELLEPSSLRATPLCPVFGQCGGCDWQHLSYSAQAEAKRSILLETLQRVGKLSEPPVGPTMAAPSPYGYRARAQFKLHRAPDGLKAGFYRRGSRFVIDLPQGCPVVTEAINGALARLRLLLEELPDADRVPQISIEQGEQGCHVIVHYIGNDPQRLVALLASHQDALELAGLFLQSGRKDTLLPVFGDQRITYCVPAGAGEVTLGYDIGGFSQVNRQQNRAMIERVRQLVRPVADGRLLDLYCGNGNFSLPLADLFAAVVGIEGYQPSIASAVDNSRQVRVNNSTFRCAYVGAELQQLTAKGERFATVLLDPPRSGALQAVRLLPQLKPQQIVYVSCDPGTLARDLAILINQGGYHVESVLPLDMFPQTGHLETVASLTHS
jgi:23S rRNA (uracil1939-C5)-methyltransferase